MNETEEMVTVGVLELAEAKRVRSSLEPKGVLIELYSNPETCQTGSCGTKVELRVRAADVPRLQQFLEGERARLLEGHEVDAGLLGEVYDSEKDSARCPACGEVFSTQQAECPGCGLGFGAE